MALSSVVSNKQLKPLRRTCAGWTGISTESECGSRTNIWNNPLPCCFLRSVIPQILLNTSICKLEMAVLAPTEDGPCPPTSSSFDRSCEKPSCPFSHQRVLSSCVSFTGVACNGFPNHRGVKSTLLFLFYSKCPSLQTPRPPTRLPFISCRVSLLGTLKRGNC